jgi:hypothetical protein
MKFLARALIFGVLPLFALIGMFGNSGKPLPQAVIRYAEVFGPQIPHEILWSEERCRQVLTRDHADGEGPDGLIAFMIPRINCVQAAHERGEIARSQPEVLRGSASRQVQTNP